MKSEMKEIISICTEPKMAKFLSKNWKREETDFVYSLDYENMDYAGNLLMTESDMKEKYLWLPISYDLKHNCLQIEWLLMKKLGVKKVKDFTFYSVPKTHTDKSYVLQCMYWLKDLIEKEG